MSFLSFSVFVTLTLSGFPLSVYIFSHTKVQPWNSANLDPPFVFKHFSCSSSRSLFLHSPSMLFILSSTYQLETDCASQRKCVKARITMNRMSCMFALLRERLTKIVVRRLQASSLCLNTIIHLALFIWRSAVGDDTTGARKGYELDPRTSSCHRTVRSFVNPGRKIS
uniref:Putative secreted protein n=1 Tax=Ixodes ricinus TaxID=34613 RepID=A0A6B0UY83_IXORI